MGREVRKVPPTWEHPRDNSGKYIPLFQEDMPQWSRTEATHFMMYENTSEGTPMSPPLASEEDLARWLVDNGASAFARDTATYEQWLNMIRVGRTDCSAVITPSLEIVSGVSVSGRGVSHVEAESKRPKSKYKFKP